MAFGTPFGDEAKAGLFLRAIKSAANALERADAKAAEWNSKDFDSSRDRFDWYDSLVLPERLKANAKAELISEIFFMRDYEVNNYIIQEIEEREEKREAERNR